MAKLFEDNADRYQPDRVHTFNDSPNCSLYQRRLATLVGFAAIGMPLIMLLGTRLGTCFYDSISHFYYLQFLGGIFLSILVFIATFLIAYRGDNSDEYKLATWAGLCALCVALFPTEGRGCEMTSFSGRALVDFSRAPADQFLKIAEASEANSFFELFPFAGTLHFVSAALLFSFLAYYTLRVFSRIIKSKHCELVDGKEVLRAEKKRRNEFYVACGWVIIVCMAIMFVNFVYEFATGSQFDWWYRLNATFWLEAFSLWAFGVSWMVKGRFFNTRLIDVKEIEPVLAP